MRCGEKLCETLLRKLVVSWGWPLAPLSKVLRPRREVPLGLLWKEDDRERAKRLAQWLAQWLTRDDDDVRLVADPLVPVLLREHHDPVLGCRHPDSDAALWNWPRGIRSFNFNSLFHFTQSNTIFILIVKLSCTYIVRAAQCGDAWTHCGDILGV